MKAFLDELKRRNVIRVGGIYLVAGWILMQAAALLEDALSMPAWFDTIIVSLILLGFPVVLLFAWLFEVTPEGLRRTPALDTPEDQAFAASTRRRLDRALIAGIVLAVAVVAADRLLPKATAPASAAATEGAAATLGASQATAPLQSQRVAFFGFITTSSDPVVKAMAEAATDQMFQIMGEARLDAAAPTETLGAPTDQRFARAGQLQAQYALSGEVRANNAGMGISVRFEDVPSKTTLWERSFRRPAPEIASLPVEAALQANNTMRCIVWRRAKLTRDTSQLLKVVADLCRNGPYANALDDFVIGRRALAQAQPDSAYFQAVLAAALAQSAANNAPDAIRSTRTAEAEAVLKRATELDPDEPYLALTRIFLAQAKRVPMAEIENIFLNALAVSEGRDAFVSATASIFYGSHLGRAGRLRESQRYLMLSMGNDPLLPANQQLLAYALAIQGQASNSQTHFEQSFTRNPSNGIWHTWISAAVFLGVGDVEAMLGSPPSMVSKRAVDCWREVRQAYRSKDRKLRELGARTATRCGDAGDLGSTRAVLASLAALDDLDAAFKLASLQNTAASYALNSAVDALFWPTSRPMRADPRLLPLMKDLGLWDYWIATGTHPDVCDLPEEKDFDVCAELRKAQGN